MAYPPGYEGPQADFRSGGLGVVSAGGHRNLGTFGISAGTEFHIYHERWMVQMEEYTAAGTDEERWETVIGPYLAVDKPIPSLEEVSLDLRIMLPDIPERWMSAGCSVLLLQSSEPPGSVFRPQGPWGESAGSVAQLAVAPARNSC